MIERDLPQEIQTSGGFRERDIDLAARLLDLQHGYAA
jgi:hypothetical protein